MASGNVPKLGVTEAEDEDESLKHRLLGPSLTKPGQDSVDQRNVSEIIYAASKGSKFFNNEQARDRAITFKIERILQRRTALLKPGTAAELAHYEKQADELIASLEASGERDLTQCIVHVDCDAFYAAVEQLWRPELAADPSIPFAVGKGVLTTCNYAARKYGCRSGMASFVALKLCPQLRLLPLNFERYTAKAREIREVLARYDPRFESASIDEAYLNLTPYLARTGLDAATAVQQMRREIHQACRVTVSAGIAANAKLAKIASDQNKPDGQFLLPSRRADILRFMHSLPARKVHGIGRVWERQLDAIGIARVGDVLPHRGLLAPLFGAKAAQFLLRTYLGLGRTALAPADDTERKSVGTKRTFADTADRAALLSRLRECAVELEHDLRRAQFRGGRTLVLKVKLHTYEVLTRQTACPFAAGRADELLRFAEPLLARLAGEYGGDGKGAFRLRLLGLRCTALVKSAAKPDLAGFFGASKDKAATCPPQLESAVDAEGWQVWPEAEFEQAAAQEEQAEREEMEQASQEYQEAKDHLLRNKTWTCPVCNTMQQDGQDFNIHIDACLSRKAISKLVREQRQDQGSSQRTAKDVPKKRGRSNVKPDQSRQVRMKPLFGYQK